MGAPNNAKWTDEHDRVLMAMWRGMSVSEIYLSGQFPSATRNAIIGRIFRLRKKWGSEVVPEKPLGGATAPKKKRARGKTTNFNIKDRAPALLREPTPLRQPLTSTQARWLPLLELGPKDCRFIVSSHFTRDHRYCAADASTFVDEYGNNCYCDFHRRLMRTSIHR